MTKQTTIVVIGSLRVNEVFMNFLWGHALLTEVLYDYSNFNFVHFLSLTHPSPVCSEFLLKSIALKFSCEYPLLPGAMLTPPLQKSTMTSPGLARDSTAVARFSNCSHFLPTLFSGNSANQNRWSTKIPIILQDSSACFNPSLAKHIMPCLNKQCRSRSVGFWRSQLIWICTVFH